MPVVQAVHPQRVLETSVDHTKARLANYQAHQNQHGFSKWIILERPSGLAIG